MSAALDRVTAIAAAVLKVPAASLQPASSPDDVATWDSVHHLQIILAVEEAFGLRFAAHEIDRLQTIGALADAVEKSAR
jgi:acyl carrier protein